MRAAASGFFARRASFLFGLFGLAGVLALASTGCVERDPFTAGDIDTPLPPRGRPADAPVTCMPAPAEPVLVEPALVESGESGRRPGTRLRETVSLGYVGDGKLTETSSQGGDYGGPSLGHGGFGGYGYGGYGYGGGRSRRGSRTINNGGGGGGGGGLNYSPATPTSGSGGRGPSGGSFGGGGASGGTGSSPSRGLR